MISVLEDIPTESEHVLVVVDLLRLGCSKQTAWEQGFLDLFKSRPQRLLYYTCLSIAINFFAQSQV